jgi:hypothetical protein
MTIAISFASAIGLAADARAQATTGSWQIGLATRALSYTKTTITSQTEFSPPIVNERSSTDWGFGERSNASLELGYGLGRHLVLGAFVALEGVAQSQNDWITGRRYEHSEFSLAAGPRVDLMLLPASIVRPFLGVAAGIIRTNRSDDWSTLSTGVPNATPNANTDDTHSSMPGWTLRGRLGIRWFIGPHFSLDPAFSFDGSFTSDTPYGEGYSVDERSFAFGLTLGGSGWIGP